MNARADSGYRRPKQFPVPALLRYGAFSHSATPPWCEQVPL
jgi:hypothetical protein